MDAETRRRVKADWVAQHRRNGAPWSGSDDELDRAFVLYDADGRPVIGISERRWMSPDLKTELMRAWVEQHRFAGAPFTGTHSALLRQWRSGERPEGPRVPRSAAERREDRRQSCARRRWRLRMRPPGLHKARNAEELLAYNADAFAAAAPKDIGALGDCECTHCGAQLWPAEAKKVPPSARGYFGTDWRGTSCCGCGAIHVPPVERSPGVEALWQDRAQAKLLRKHARPLNNSLALASSSISQPRNLPGGSSWSPTVSVQGKIYHNIGALNPADGADRRWAQMYVFDPSFDETTERLASLRLGSRNVSQRERANTEALLTALQHALHTDNSYVQDFITAGELFEEEPATPVELVLSRDARPADAHARQYDPATTGGRGQPRSFAEVTVLMLEGQLETGCVQLRRRDGPLYRINFNHRSFDPLHFVLLFPCGDDGWIWNMPRVVPAAAAPSDGNAGGDGGEQDDAAQRAHGGGGGGDDDDDDDDDDPGIADGGSGDDDEGGAAADARAPAGSRRKQVTPREYFAHRLHVRLLDDDGGGRDHALHRWGRLFQEYCCVALAKAEAERLRWYEKHQEEIRADLYQGLADAVDSSSGAQVTAAQPRTTLNVVQVAGICPSGSQPGHAQHRELSCRGSLGARHDDAHRDGLEPPITHPSRHRRPRRRLPSDHVARSWRANASCYRRPSRVGHATWRSATTTAWRRCRRRASRPSS